MIVVGIAQHRPEADLNRRLDMKRTRRHGDTPIPPAAGGDTTFGFQPEELMPQIEKRYRTSCYRAVEGALSGRLDGDSP